MEKNKDAKHGFVETYADDMAKVLEDDKNGIIKKIIHQEEEHEKEKISLSPESQKNKFFMFASFVFILTSLVILFYFIFVKKVDTIPVEKQFTPIIFVDQSNFIEAKGLTKDKIIEAILNKISITKINSGETEGIYLSYDKRVMGLREFIQLIKANFVPDVSSNNIIFVDDNFLMGVVNTESQSDSTFGKDFFILLKMRSVTDIFDAMRAWEGKMFFDLHKFFNMNISSETKYLLSAVFADGIVENKNARILYDKDNKIVMMYVWADDNSVIITNTNSAAREIMRRLTSGQIKK